MEGKYALVTGGAQGLGLAYIKELLVQGIEGVTLVDRKAALGKAATAALNREFHEKVIFVEADVTEADQFEAAFKISVEKWNFIDVVINNAGILDEEQWEAEILVNCGGTARGVSLGYKYMNKTKNGRGGTIINISSLAAVNPQYCFPWYTASKCYVNALTKTLGNPFYSENSGIKVMALCPGLTNTPIVGELKTKGPTTLHPGVLQRAAIETEPFPLQQPENVAKQLVKVINEGDSGSIWVIEGGNLAYEVQLSVTPKNKKNNN